MVTLPLFLFKKVVQLASYPQDVPKELVNLGLTMEINELRGEPLYDANDNIIDPLQNANYTGHYRGKQYSECLTKLEIGKKFFREIGDTNSILGDSEGHGHRHGKEKGHGHGKGKGKGKGKNH